MTTPHNRLGERHGPITAADAAAREYHEKYRWPCGARAGEVWICLPCGAAALAVDPPLAQALHGALLDNGAAGPVAQWPGNPASWEFFIQGPTQLDEPTRRMLYRHGILYRGANRLVDLPPSRHPTGSHTWIAPPTRIAAFPRLDVLLAVLAALKIGR